MYPCSRSVLVCHVVTWLYCGMTPARNHAHGLVEGREWTLTSMMTLSYNELEVCVMKVGGITQGALLVCV